MSAQSTNRKPPGVGAIAALISVAAFAGCSSGEQKLPNVVGYVDGTHTGVAQSGPCNDGERRSCSLTVGEADGVLSCYDGVQSCMNGSWSACADGTVRAQALDARGRGLTIQALSTQTPCSTNPCDPTCQNYQEQPDGGYRPTTSDTPVVSWVEGSLAGYPAGLRNKGIVEPCSSGSDCQFNHYCANPVTGSSCAHSKCAVGTTLQASCDNCVADVCAANPSCCQTEYPDCGHDACTVGSKLKSTCDSCVAAICAVDSSCCSGAWTQSCVDKVATVCNRTCACDPGEVASASGDRCYYFETNTNTWDAARTACQSRGTGWDLVAVGAAAENSYVAARIGGNSWIGGTDGAVEGAWVWPGSEPFNYAHWNAGEPNQFGGNEDCMTLYTNGFWNDQSCSTAQRSVCEGPSNRSGGWSRACVDAAETLCDVSCGSSTPSTCTHDSCALGEALNKSCDPCVARICASDPSCCTGTWDSMCIAEVSSICGLDCPAPMTQPPPSDGSCVSWIPGQTDSTCNDVDLAAGTPCDSTIPICNHGTKTAPAGIRIIHFPANSNQYPKCDPDQTHPQMVECFTDKAIPPGKCIDVKSCTGLIGNREIMVNPSGAAHVSECSCKDNWTLYSGGTCAPPSCPTCPKALATTTFTQIYQASCPDGMGPQWGYMSWDTSTPSDSSVAFQVRTASTSADLATASFVAAGTAQSTPTNTQICAMSGPSPCPVALYPLLGGVPGAKYGFLELSMTLTPASDQLTGPTVNKWQITYSCTDNQ